MSIKSEYLETKNDGPNKSESQAGATVNDIVRSHVFQVNTLVSKKL